MAVPIIVSILPAEGPAGGRTLIEIKANNLRLPDAQPATGPSEARLPTVQVLFDGEPATNVLVFSKGRLTCLTPPVSTTDPIPKFKTDTSGRRVLDSNGQPIPEDFKLVDVTINNLDNNGDPIPGETVTRVDGFRYSRPDLSDETQSDLLRLVRTLIRKLRSEVIRNVVITSHTDFDDTVADSLNRVELADMPGIILVGPSIPENRFFSRNDREIVTRGVSGAVIRRVPYTVDVEFDFIGVAEKQTTLINLEAATVQFFHRNKIIELLRDPTDPSLGRVRYEMDLVDLPEVGGAVNNSNVRNFSGSMVIRGFDLEDLAGVADDAVVGESTKITETILDIQRKQADPC